ncbi:hypothetical protein A6770_39090 [Nostoc minutum NIES-26]|uniref:Uncharacterized protein n=1 Tax=Nostoc minutum NIES-26 TaxID=1844469 RepID=A0A367RR99_9NOSO|nr:hypothetical protein A6770_39090 [Nostoc minutum NIES-26]
MSAKIDANKNRLEAAYQWQAFKIRPLLLMGCIVVPLFVGSYVYTSWQQTKNQSQAPFVEIKDLPLRCGEGSE